MLSRLSDKELGDLAVAYERSAPVSSTDLLRLFAKKLDGISLSRVARAFGSGATEAVVQTYSSANVQREFVQAMATVKDEGYSNADQSTSTGATPMGSPTLDMTLQEIYLDFRTAPVGSLSVSSSIVQTGIYSGGWLYGAWNAGYDFGTGIHDLIEIYDPSFDTVLGGTIQQAVENIGDGMDQWSQGNFEWGWDSLFGSPLGSDGAYSGDWNVGASYDFFEDAGGGGC